ncbi:MAPEG family protein [Ponticaulis sp.]|uniref:MAPEG family protein n=1 Tax=Ponticaulis sp. TaxID=2020902 RepID=UPI00262BCBAA|nr:MAPEG family protein [Ponticaulis sp.]MDF1680540.1 MAPEG family protein [Ponticaulis sp.]
MPTTMESLNSAALLPVLALITWTLIIWIWMYATRIPAMSKAGIDPQDGQRTGKLANALPDSVAFKADNYNHLLEQPVIFYALAFFLSLGGGHDSVNVALLWGYVVLRVVHSLIQCTVNHVVSRFLVFTLSTICLIVIVVREILRIFLG